jgi:hypothetical protein
VPEVGTAASARWQSRLTLIPFVAEIGDYGVGRCFGHALGVGGMLGAGAKLNWAIAMVIAFHQQAA